MKKIINLLKQNDEETNKLGFTGAEVALHVMMDEYAKSKERAQIIDNKAIALLTILVALLTIYMPLIPYEKFHKVFSEGTKANLVILVIAAVLLVLALIISVVVFYKLIKTIKTQAYKQVDVNELVDADTLIYPKDEVEKALCVHYKEIIENNSNINDSKTTNMQRCFTQVIAIFFLLLVSTVAVLFI